MARVTVCRRHPPNCRIRWVTARRLRLLYIVSSLLNTDWGHNVQPIDTDTLVDRDTVCRYWNPSCKLAA